MRRFVVNGSATVEAPGREPYFHTFYYEAIAQNAGAVAGAARPTIDQDAAEAAGVAALVDYRVIITTLTIQEVEHE